MHRAVLFLTVVALGLTGCRTERPVDGNRRARYKPPVDAGPSAPPKADAGRAVAPTDAGPVVADDHGDDAEHATPTQVDWTARGTLTAGDVDWFEFVALPADLHRVETRGNTDTRCALYNAGGQRVAEADDGGDGFNCRMVEALVAGALYRVEVRHFSEGEGGDYELFIGLVAAQQASPDLASNAAQTTAGDPLAVTGQGFTPDGYVVLEVVGPGDRVMDGAGISADAEGRVAHELQTDRTWVVGGYRMRGRDTVSAQVSDWLAFAVLAPAADDHGDRREEATRLPTGGPTGGEIHIVGDVDWFHFDVERPGAWVVETRGTLDTRCTLYAPDHRELADSDDDGEGLNCRIELTLNQLGSHSLKVDAFGDRTGFYEVWLIAPPVPDDHGDTRATATVILGPVTIGAEIGAPGDVDVFGFTAALQGIYDLSTFGFIDTYCVLYDQNGGVVFEDDDSGMLLNCSFRRFLNAQRTYYLAVRHSNNRSTGGYSVLVNRPDGVPPDDHGNTSVAATLVPASGTFSGAIEVGGDHDVFRVAAQTSGVLSFATVSDGDTYCHLFDDGGVEVAINDDDGDRLNCRIVHPVQAGRTYFLKVRLYNVSAEGSYRLRIQGG